MRPLMIAGNWKMHGSKSFVADLLGDILPEISALTDKEIVVFPPSVFLEQVARLAQNSRLVWGGQNVATEMCGAFTGEISASMLLEFGCRYVLVGHSERRSLYGETDTIVAKKFAIAKAVGLQPVLCVGETLAERRQELTQQVIERQLDAVLNLAGGVSNFANVVVAYEPVWAIGTGLAATPIQAQEVHAMIRAKIAQFDVNIAAKLPILYGGSVKPENAAELFAAVDIDGGLIGGASLKAAEFLDICQCKS